jgi:hypothetical protein
MRKKIGGQKEVCPTFFHAYLHIFSGGCNPLASPAQGRNTPLSWIGRANHLDWQGNERFKKKF